MKGKSLMLPPQNNPMTCPNCQHEVSPGAAFCGNCGFQLAQPGGQFAPAPGVAPGQPTPQSSIISPSTQTPQSVPPGQSNPLPAQQIPQAQSFQSQPAVPYYDAGGGVMTPYTTQNGASEAPNNGKAIASFVMGVLGCVGWLIPLIGVILGILALVFGTMSLKSPRRIFAIIGIVLAVPVIAVSIFFWVKAAEHIIKTKSSSLSGLTTHSTASSLQTVRSPCYTTKIPANLTLTQTASSCTFEASSTTSGEEYVVKVLQAPTVSATNLADGAKADSANVVNAIPGGSITGQQATTFANSPAYSFDLAATDGSAGTLDYIYDNTSQGNLVIILHAQRTGKDIDLATIEKNWSWQ